MDWKFHRFDQAFLWNVLERSLSEHRMRLIVLNSSGSPATVIAFFYRFELKKFNFDEDQQKEEYSGSGNVLICESH
jgi:hypothetical protein